MCSPGSTICPSAANCLTPNYVEPTKHQKAIASYQKATLALRHCNCLLHEITHRGIYLDYSMQCAKGGCFTCRAEAVARFVAEAVTLLLRKPHEIWELQQELLSAASPETGAPHLETETSLLPVTALRQAIRVAGSSKIPQASIMAICKYVKGEAASSGIRLAVCQARHSTCKSDI